MSKPHQASLRVTFDSQEKPRKGLEVMSFNHGEIQKSNGDGLPEPNRADLGNADRAVAEPPQHSKFLTPHRRPLAVSGPFTAATRPRSCSRTDCSPINEGITVTANSVTQPVAGPSSSTVAAAYPGYGLNSIGNKTCFARRSRTLSPDNFRRSTSPIKLKRVLESEELDSGVPSILSDERDMETDPPAGFARQGDDETDERFTGYRYYGSVGYGQTTGQPDGVRYTGTSLEFVEDEDLDDEEEELVLDEELAKEGLYRGNYKTMLLLYTFVPFSVILTFVFLALLPHFAYSDRWASYFPYPLYLPFPLPELITATALWSLAYLLPDFLYATSQFFVSLLPLPSVVPILTSFLAALLQTTATLIIRLLAIPILLIPYYSSENQVLSPREIPSSHHYPNWHDDAFRRVWWVALGWAAAEAVVGIKQGYESITLYKDVLVSVHRNSPGKEEMGPQLPPNRTEEDERAGRTLSPVNLMRPTAVQDQQLHDVDTTATQQDWGNHDCAPGPSRGRDVNPQRAAFTSSYRPHSLSSISTSVVQDDILSHSGILMRSASRPPPLEGERQPLLSDLSLSRMITNQSDPALVQDVVESDLEELMALKSREEMEEVYGMPVIRIPVFISCLHRINSILSCLGIYLLLSAAFMRSRFAYVRPGSPKSNPANEPLSILLNLRSDSAISHPHPSSNRLLLVTFFSLLLIQTLMAFMHTSWILPTIGIHTFVYVGLLVSLGLFFGGLGIWEALT